MQIRRKMFANDFILETDNQICKVEQKPTKCLSNKHETELSNYYFDF